MLLTAQKQVRLIDLGLANVVTDPAQRLYAGTRAGVCCPVCVVTVAVVVAGRQPCQPRHRG